MRNCTVYTFRSLLVDPRLYTDVSTMRNPLLFNTIRGCLLASAMSTNVALSGEHERRQMDAHEHGITALNIALDGDTLLMELEGPAMNFVGFEHPPETAEQKRAIEAALKTLNGDPQLFVFSDGAGCSLSQAGIRHILDDDDHDDHDDHHDSDDHDDHDDHHDSDGHDDHKKGARHSEFAGEYQFECANPGKFKSVSIGLFKAFPLTTEVEVSFIGPDVQTFKELTADDPVLELNR